MRPEDFFLEKQYSGRGPSIRCETRLVREKLLKQLSAVPADHFSRFPLIDLDDGKFLNAVRNVFCMQVDYNLV